MSKKNAENQEVVKTPKLTITIEKTSERVNFNLDGDVSIYSVKKLKDVFFQNIEGLQNVECTLSNVNKMDTAGFQLLLLIKRELKEKNIAFQCEPSESIIETFTFYNEEL